uniref:Uncharacterized protein n=1 Tax=Heterorhabditis bacteriophora TaxID=37862 RepID=A0A1I7XTM0_HETBA
MERRIYAQFFFSATLISRQENLNPRKFLRASKALRKPLTTSGWTRLELPSGKGSRLMSLLGGKQSERSL